MMHKKYLASLQAHFLLIVSFHRESNYSSYESMPQAWEMLEPLSFLQVEKVQENRAIKNTKLF